MRRGLPALRWAARRLFAALLAAIAAPPAGAIAAATGSGEAVAPASQDVEVGRRFEYEVRSGDSLSSVSARFGVGLAVLARSNGLAPESLLRIGQRLQIESFHLVSGRLDDGILINVPQRMLFLFRGGRVATAYPVGLGRPGWPTQVGSYRVASRVRDKTWYVPRSIQAEMRAEGKPVLTQVPPGPDNPLGGRWLGLEGIACGIHGTVAPSSIYGFRSHGCIRLHEDDVDALFEQVAVGEPVEVIYRPLLLAATADGRVLLEVHSDVYHRAEPPLEALCAEAGSAGLAAQLDRARALETIAAAEGAPRDVTASADGSAAPICPAPQAARNGERSSQAGSG